MTETQAKSGGPSTTPVEEEPKADGPTPGGRSVPPADAPSPPKFTRAPGMTPPPGEPSAESETSPSRDAKRQGGQGVVKGSATVPILTKGKGAPPGAAPGRTSGAVPTGRQSAAPPRSGGGPGRPGAPADAGKRPSGAAAIGAARVTEVVRSARSTVSSAAARGPRRARLNLKRIDPWSVMKFSFAVSVVLFIVVVVATSVLYLALDAMGVWTEINKSLGDLVNASGGTSSAASNSFRVTAWGVIGTSMLIGAVNVVLFTALATLGAFIYNVCADLVGGVELTLAERD